MMITRDNLVQIVAQASSLAERLDSRLFAAAPAQSDERHGHDRLIRWRRIVEGSGQDLFCRRLQWSGWEIERVLPLLGEVQLTNQARLPGWAETLDAVMRATAAWAPQDAGSVSPRLPINAEHPLPFEDLLLPAILVARNRLLNQLGCRPADVPLALLSEEAYLALERNLLQKLTGRCARTLEAEFSRARPAGHSLLPQLLGQAQHAPGSVYYTAFVQDLLRDGLLAFFLTYPVLGRVLATTIDFWVEATAELLHRLEADADKIQRTFDRSEHQPNRSFAPLGNVVEITPALSDPHRRGRSVAAITFESGLRLIYKPKDLGLELAYNQLLAWCNRQDASLAFKVIKVLDRGAYGWVEHVQQSSCADAAAAERFYRRAGMLLCLLYVLGATDCHHENLIASGEHLVLIDMETLMHPDASQMYDLPDAERSGTSAGQQFWDSVLRTGLLPRWEFDKDNRVAYDASGLGSVESEPRPIRAARWRAVNTDGMHLAYEIVTRPPQGNMPTLGGAALSPNDYLDELAAGFEHMYRLLMLRREALLAPAGPLAALRAQPVRFVFRATQVYDVVLRDSLGPGLMRNGADRSIALDILSRAFLAAARKPSAWPILQAELAAMEQLDIPYFEARADSAALTIGLDTLIEGCFQAPGYSQMVDRVRALDEDDLARQLAIIRGTFYARAARAVTAESPTPDAARARLKSPLRGVPPSVHLRGRKQSSRPRRWTASRRLIRRGFNRRLQNRASHPLALAAECATINRLTTEQLLDAATRIAQEIAERALRGADGTATWIGLGYAPVAERFQFQPLGDSLYEGNSGIALFLAALSHVSGTDQFRELALGALQALGRFVRESDAGALRRFARYSGIGGASGLGSLVYALVTTGRLLREPALIEHAQRIARLITTELIAADQQLDVVGGAAGAALGLLALHRETGDPLALDRAVQCGQHLLAQRLGGRSTHSGWITVAEQPLTGFSHGAAGIAYALLRLYAATADEAYLAAARAGIAFERSVFSEAAGNWPDFRAIAERDGQPGAMVSWCHGAPGIGLARLGGLPVLAGEEVHQDIDLALHTTRTHSLSKVDHLCCGNLGRAEVLLVAAEKLACPELRETAQTWAAWVAAKATQAGAYQLFHNLPAHVFHPGFFQGTSGIGYQLLRLAYPNRLPSVLLWE